MAVLTPRNNDLSSGNWTRAAALTTLKISVKRMPGKKKTRRQVFASNENKISHSPQAGEASFRNIENSLIKSNLFIATVSGWLQRLVRKVIKPSDRTLIPW